MKRMVQLSCLTATFLLVALVLWQSPSAALATRNAETDSNLIDALDDCIQQRFKEIDKSFGFRRVMRAGDTPHQFKPENAKEVSSVSELNSRKVEVALYLGSRSLLGDKPDEQEWIQDRLVSTTRGTTSTAIGTGTGFSRKIIKGPVLISTKAKEDLPMPSELWEQSKFAMQAFATKEVYEFKLGNWQFSARPVRASEQSCLQCHSVDSRAVLAREPNEELKPLKIGDPLGVVLYAYREGK
jgi:hypothetical protein